MNTTPHNATPEAWASVRRRAEISGISDCCVIVELAARVEALEREAASAEVRPAPASSLVERVAKAINRVSPWRHKNQARAAIREIAVAARAQEGQPLTWEHVAQWLEQEADR